MRTRILLSTLLAFLPVAAGAADAAAPAVVAVPAKPSPRAGDADFPMPSPSARHAEKVAAVRSGRFDLALIGDSITHTVGELGGKYEPLRAVWDKHFAPRRAINLGHNGQRTENILWNLADGELDFVVSPKVVVVLIGGSSLGVLMGGNFEVMSGLAVVVGSLQVELVLFLGNHLFTPE